jgi:hypothetical protein
MTTMATTLTAGQSVVWLSRILGVYGPDWIDGRNVALIDAEIVKVAAKRVQIRVAPGGQVRWVDPVNLRWPNDPAVVEALEARGQDATRQAPEYQADAQRRVLQVLTCIAPDVPFPLQLIRDIVSIDLMTSGPYQSVFDNLVLAPFVAEAALNTTAATQPITVDLDQDTVTISAPGQALAKAQLAALPMTEHAARRQRTGLDDAGIALVVEMYDATAYKPGYGPLSREQLGWLAVHLGVLIAAELARADEDDDGLAHALVVLWLLNSHGVVAGDILDAQTRALMDSIEPRASGWNDWQTAHLLIEAVALMIDTHQAAAYAFGSRLLDRAASILHRDTSESWDDTWRDIDQLRQRLGAATP